MEVTFDPRRISYDELLERYWNSFPFQLPSGPDRVRNVVIPQTEAQWSKARAAKKRLGKQSGTRVYTEIIPGGAFWPAERKHQKFDLQRMHRELVQELAAGSDVEHFLASPAATRLNAYVTGFADDAVLHEIAHELGWETEALRARLQSTSANK